MTTDLYLGVDQGTSSTKGVLIDTDGEEQIAFSSTVPPRTEQGRLVEQDAEGLLSSVVEVFLKAKAWAANAGRTIKNSGLAVQRSGVLAWNSTDGVPLHPVITWADTRTYTIIQNFGRGTERISSQTGIPTIPNFAGGKIHQLQRQFLESSVHVATLDSFLLYRLSGRKVFITDDTMAARTMLYSLADRNWNDQLCRDFQVEARRLPRINPSLAPHTTFEGVPIGAVIGDQQAALIGRLSTSKRPLLNLGTIASLMVDTGREIVQHPGLMTSVLASRLVPNSYIREYRFLTEITSAITGPVLNEVFTRTLARDPEHLKELCEASLVESPVARATAYFVHHRPTPPLMPARTPNVMIEKNGVTDADRARAIVENVGNLVIRLLEEFADKGLLGMNPETTGIDLAGGGSESEYLAQYLADCTGYTFHRLKNRDAGTRGAALCAWMSAMGTFDAASLNRDEPVKSYVCENPDRRRAFLGWQRLERDLLNGSLPQSAIVES